MPDISMAHLAEEELEDLRDVSLADAIRVARRRSKIKFDKLREATNAHFDERLTYVKHMHLVPQRHDMLPLWML